MTQDLNDQMLSTPLPQTVQKVIFQRMIIFVPKEAITELTTYILSGSQKLLRSLFNGKDISRNVTNHKYLEM